MGIVLSMVLGIWWVSGLGKKWREHTWLWAENLWIYTAGVGFIIFTLLTIPQFEIVAIAMALIQFVILHYYEHLLQEGSWPVRAYSLLDFFNLLAFFLLSLTVLHASEYYSWSVGVLMIIFAVQAIISMQIRYWREKIANLRKWFYILVTVLALEEVVWVLSFWHRGVYLKGFIAAVIFYLMSDFVLHYQKGTLTVRVALEYIGLAGLMLLVIFLFDTIFVLR